MQSITRHNRTETGDDWKIGEKNKLYDSGNWYSNKETRKNEAYQRSGRESANHQFYAIFMSPQCIIVSDV